MPLRTVQPLNRLSFGLLSPIELRQDWAALKVSQHGLTRPSKILAGVVLRPMCERVVAQMGHRGKSVEHRSRVATFGFSQADLLGDELGGWLSALKLRGVVVWVGTTDFAVLKQHQQDFEGHFNHMRCKRFTSSAANTSSSTEDVVKKAFINATRRAYQLPRTRCGHRTEHINHVAVA